MCYTVYKITNDVNPKEYIGVHRTNNPHDRYLGSGVLIKKAIQKYGRDCFHKEILLETDNIDEAFRLEYELTEGMNPSNSYNMIRGGIRIPPADYELVKVRRASARLGGLNNKGKFKTSSHREKISKSTSGRKRGKYNLMARSVPRPHSDETKEKIRQKALDRWSKTHNNSP